MEATFWQLVSWCTEHIRSVNLGIDTQSECLLCSLSILHLKAQMESTFWRLGSWCTEHIRSVHDMHRVTTGYLFRVNISTAHISSNGSHFFPAGFLDHKRSVKLGIVCFYMLCSLLNVLAHHLWVQFSKSTLLTLGWANLPGARSILLSS